MTSYQEIFKIYLEFNPYFRRRLIKIKDICKLIESLKIIHHLENERNLKIFLEYLFQNNIITPFFKIEFPVKHKFLVRWNDESILTNDISRRTWEEVYEENLIKFLDNEEEKNKKWNYKKEKNKIEQNLYAIKETIYYYHPIQFIQLISILDKLRKSNPDLLSIKSYFDYYWKRFFEFEDDSYVKRVKASIDEDRISIEDYINKCREGQKIRFKEIYPVYTWLKPDAFKVWIKLESIFSPDFYTSSTIKAPIELKRDIVKKEEKRETFQKDFEYIKEKKINIQKYFTSEETKEIKDLLFIFEEEHDFEGLYNWFDLMLQISSSKKNKLKGFLSFYVNSFEIIKTLKLALWYLEPDEQKKNKIRPEFLFEDGREKNRDKEIYMQYLLRNYDLFLEKIYIIYVEGPTEEEILKLYFSAYYRIYGFINIDVHNMTGESNKDFTFGYALRNFKTKKCFLFLDADSDESEEKRRSELRLNGIEEKSFVFFRPDFVTKNFSDEQIYEAYLKYLEAEKVQLSEECSDFIKNGLTDCKLNNKSIEKYLEIFHNTRAENVSYLTFSKTGFAKFLAELVIKENPSEKRFPFQQALQSFFDEININSRKYWERKGYTLIS